MDIGYSKREFFRLRHALILEQAQVLGGNFEHVIDGLTLEYNTMTKETYIRWSSEAVEANIYQRVNGSGVYMIICEDAGHMDAHKVDGNFADDAHNLWNSLGEWS